jgi:uncharacterized protein YndB with AHSA1/START domain
MKTPTTIAPLQRTVTVPVGLEHAFIRFTQEMGLWWPEDDTWTGEGLESIGIEPGVGGVAYERGPDDTTLIWGKVLDWEPQHRLILAWLIGPDRQPIADPARASEIELRFVPLSPAETRVTLEHRGFERHGEDGSTYRAALDTPQGWDRILNAYAATDGY